MKSASFHASILELIHRTSAFLPPDVSEVIDTHRALEQAGSKADLGLSQGKRGPRIAGRGQRQRIS